MKKALETADKGMPRYKESNEKLPLSISPTKWTEEEEEISDMKNEKDDEIDVFLDLFPSPKHGVFNPHSQNYLRMSSPIGCNRGKDPIFEKLEIIEKQVLETKQEYWLLEKRCEEILKELFEMRLEERYEWFSIELDEWLYEQRLEKRFGEKANYPRTPSVIERNRGNDPIFEKLEIIEQQVLETKQENRRLEKRFEEILKELFEMCLEERYELSSKERDEWLLEQCLEKDLGEKANYPSTPTAIERNRGKDPIFEKLVDIVQQVLETKQANRRLEKRYDKILNKLFEMCLDKRYEWSSVKRDEWLLEQRLKKRLEEKTSYLRTPPVIERNTGKDPIFEKLENIVQQVRETKEANRRLEKSSGVILNELFEMRLEESCEGSSIERDQWLLEQRLEKRLGEKALLTRRQLQGLADTVSQRVVASMRIEKSRVLRGQQSQTSSEAGISDQSRHVSSSSECMCSHCKRKCTCRCHLVDPVEIRKDSEESGRTKRTLFRPMSSEDERKTDSESDANFTFNVFDISDLSDDGLPMSVDTNPANKEDGECTTPVHTDQHPISVIRDNHTHVASGGDPGQPSDDDPSSDDESDGEGHKKVIDKDLNEKRKKKNWVIDHDAWKECIECTEQDFQTRASCLLLDGKLPNQTLLDEICLIYNRTNPYVQEICKSICCYIKDKSKSFLEVWAAYQYKKGDASYGNEVVFVILTDSADAIEVEEFKTYKRNIMEITSKEENDAIKTKEKENPPTDGELKDLETCLKENAKLLMERHGNLTRVTASWCRSSGFGTDQVSLQRECCIALYVHVKGYVPLHEKPFDSKIGTYPVDVREGISILCAGEPSEYHRNLKMGCAICGTKQGDDIFAGTLGAFIEFNDENLYAITSAHVLFQGEKLKNIIESGKIDCRDKNEIVFQPPSHNVDGICGEVEGVIYRQGGNGVIGMEIAVIRINPKRHPVAGTFPNDSGLSEKGFGPEKPLEFFTGRCCLPEHLSYMRLVYKYGFETKLTIGACRVIGASVRTRVLTDTSFSIVLHDQTEIESVGNTPFADYGDSGAVVLTYHGTELIAVGIFEGKSEMDGVYFITPILPILNQLATDANKECKLKPFKMYNQPIVDVRLHDEDSTNQKLRDELRQEFRKNFEDHKTEIKKELNENFERQGNLIQNQNKELNERLTLIQNLLQSSTRQNTS